MVFEWGDPFKLLLDMLSDWHRLSWVQQDELLGYHSLARTVNTLWMREGMGNFRTPSKKNYEIHHHEKGEWGKVWKCLSVQSGNNPKTTLHFVPWNLLYFSNPSSTVSGNEKKKRISMYFLKFYPLLRPTEVDLSIPCTSNFVNIARR